MNKFFILTFFVSALSYSVFAQSRKELDERRKSTLEEIEYVDGLLKKTTKEKSDNLNEIRVIGKKLSLREKIINEYGDEISLLEYRISLNKIACDMMEDDLKKLREEYRESILNAYKTTKGTPAIAYILGSRDINQGYKRLRYMQQIARYRRNEAEVITDIYKQLQSTRNKMATDLNSVTDLKDKEERQKEILNNEQKSKEILVKSLTNKEKDLKKQLEEKKRVAKQIEAEIARIIEEEKKSIVTAPITKELKLAGDSFESNKGKLPWPVDRGIVTSHFGIQPHPVLTHVTEDNIGIEITTDDNAKAKAVFKGQVVRVFAISGANMAVIIRHGKYLTVYQNLVNVTVKAGETVDVRKELGDVFMDSSDGNKSILKFMIYEEKSKLDPEAWLMKKSN